jgi:hypothetical protein
MVEERRGRPQVRGKEEAVLYQWISAQSSAQLLSHMKH